MNDKKNPHQEDLLPAGKGAVYLGQRYVHFSIKSNKRIKRVRLVASPEEGLIVETPGQNMNMAFARQMIQDQKEWVARVINRIDQKKKYIAEIKTHLNSILVFGHEKILAIRTGESKDFILETKDKLILGLIETTPSPEKVDAILRQWLHAKAQRYFSFRVWQINQGRFPLNRVRVKSQKSLWGSCSANHNIQINWRLIMAPRFVSDYIILHELCHTLFMNHSKKFWDAVAKNSPEYLRAEAWLDKYGFLLHADFISLVAS